MIRGESPSSIGSYPRLPLFVFALGLVSPLYLLYRLKYALNHYIWWHLGKPLPSHYGNFSINQTHISAHFDREYLTTNCIYFISSTTPNSARFVLSNKDDWLATTKNLISENFVYGRNAYFFTYCFGKCPNYCHFLWNLHRIIRVILKRQWPWPLWEGIVSAVAILRGCLGGFAKDRQRWWLGWV